MYFANGEKEEKKGKEILKRIVEELKRRKQLEDKYIERDHGFLIHLSHIYEIMCCYLKRLYHTLDVFRKRSDKKEWKVKKWDLVQLFCNSEG